MRLDLALILLQGTSTSGPCVLGTLPCDEQVTVETDQPDIELSIRIPVYDRTFHYIPAARKSKSVISRSPYALGAGLDALGSRPHLFRAGLDALHLIRAVILLPGPDLDLLVLPDLFVPVVVGEAGLEQVVTVLLERGVVTFAVNQSCSKMARPVGTCTRCVS